MSDKQTAARAASVAHERSQIRYSSATTLSKAPEECPRERPARTRSYDAPEPVPVQSTKKRPSPPKHETDGQQLKTPAVNEAGHSTQRMSDEKEVVPTSYSSVQPVAMPTGKADDRKGSISYPSLESRDEGHRSEDDSLKPSDLYFVVMGVTGAGKSTFISLLTDDDTIEVGHELQSNTKQVSIHMLRSENVQKAWLIDTPGFDDTERPNVEILKEIVFYLTKLYRQGGSISGLIYLHRITDPRMPGSAVKNLEIFKLLTGSSAMPIVRLVTTRWSELDPMSPDYEKAEKLERQLHSSERFWATMIRDGARTWRHTGDRESAQFIISSLLPGTTPPKLAIQIDMVDRNISLPETAAGKYICNEDEQIRKQYEAEIEKLQEERKQALEEKDHEAAQALHAEELEYLRRREQLLAAKSDLNVDFQRLNEQTYERLTGGGGQSIQPSPPDETQDLKIVNELLFQEKADLENEMSKKDRQHRIEIQKMQQAMAQQNAQQHEGISKKMHEMIREYELDRRQMYKDLSQKEYDINKLKKKNKRLKDSSGSILGFFL